MTTVISPPLKTGLILWGLGLAGIASLLTTHFPLTNLPRAVLEKFSPGQLQVLMLVNPTLFLILAVIVGSLLYRTVHLTLVPTELITPAKAVRYSMSYGVIPGIGAGLLILSVATMFQYLIPAEMAALNGADTTISPLARFLYGGITEEIVLRFGLMTLFVWTFGKLVRTHRPVIYWLGISGSALLFGAGHLPALHLIVPHPSGALVLYIILGNAVAGLVFGWAYWRYGLVMAMIAHVVSHIILLVSDWLLA